MEKLTLSDFDILIEALTAWETKDAAGEMVSSLITGVMMPKGTREDPKFMQEEEDRKTTSTQAKAVRMEASILLKAKLISMKTQAFTDTL